MLTLFQKHVSGVQAAPIVHRLEEEEKVWQRFYLKIVPPPSV